MSTAEKLAGVVDQVKKELAALPLAVRLMAAPIINPIVARLETIIAELE